VFWGSLKHSRSHVNTYFHKSATKKQHIENDTAVCEFKSSRPHPAAENKRIMKVLLMNSRMLVNQ